MADKGRDLTARFLTDTDQFHTDKVANGLDDVARSADKADEKLDSLGKSTGLDDVASDADKADAALDDLSREVGELNGELNELDAALKDAERELKAAGEAGDDLGKKLQDAFERAKAAAKEARESSEDIGKGISTARERVNEFRDEGVDTAREVAASFDGSAASIADGFQEVAANAAAAFGPVGLAIGIVSAVGLGALRAQQEKVREETTRLTAAIQALQSGTEDADSATKSYLDGLEDQGKTLRDLKSDAEALGLSLDVVAAAQAGNAEAIQTVGAAVEDYKRRSAEFADQVGDNVTPIAEMLGQTIGLSEATADLGDTYGKAKETNDLYTEALGKSSEAAEKAAERQADLATAFEGFVDPLAVYTESVQKMAQETADKTKDQKDSWEDYADSTKVSLDGVIEALEKQVTAAEQWEANMDTLAGKVSENTLNYLRKLGPEGAPLVQQLVDSSDEQMSRFEDLMARRAAAGVDGAKQAITDKRQVLADAGKMLGDDFAKGLTDGINSGADDAVSAAQKIRDRIADVYKNKIKAMVELGVDQNSISLVRQEAAMAARYRP